MELQADFPSRRPIVRSLTPIRHRLFDSSNRVVGHPKLQSWSPYNDLGRILLEITQELRRNPPAFVQPGAGHRDRAHARGPLAQATPVAIPQATPVVQPTARPYAGGPVNGARSYSGGVVQQQARVGAQPIITPAVYNPPRPNLAFHLLDAYNTEELTKLLASDVEITALVDSLDEIQQADKKKEELYKTVESLAQKNLEHKPTIEGLQQTVREMRAKEAAAWTRVDELSAKQRGVMSKYSRETISKRLADAANQADDASEAVNKEFSESGGKDYEGFIAKYIDARVLHHTRKAKQERLASAIAKMRVDRDAL